jgi:hypothetical protein
LNGEEGGAANKACRGKNGGFVPVYVSFSSPVGWVTFFHSLGRENRKYTPDQKHRSTREPTIHRQSDHQTPRIRGLLLNKPTERCISLKPTGTFGWVNSQIFDNFFTLRFSPFNLGSLKSGVEIKAASLST